ncbi:MAG: peptidylprolyl isomerase [Acidobacteriota bacterium]|nr:peptidylprolyl isomerase [Acidobacteriota bacterium]
MTPRIARILILAGMTFVSCLAVQGEVIEEIVAKVNDDIITKTEIEGQERALIAEIYRRYTGPDLDEKVQEGRKHLLQSMIDNKILIHRAERLYDMEVVEQVLLENFMADQGIEDMEELERMLAQQGASLDQLKRRLVSMFAPEEVIRFEVVGRQSIGDREVEKYYHDNIKDYEVPAEVTLREIVLAAATEEEKAGRRAEAEQIRARVTTGGESFGEVAAEVSDAGSKDAGGLIGPLHRGDLAEPLDEAAFTLPVGEVSEIIETELALHIIKVETRREDGVIPFEEVKDEVRAQLQDQRYNQAIEEFMVKARDEAEIVVMPKYREKYDWTGPVSQQE